MSAATVVAPDHHSVPAIAEWAARGAELAHAHKKQQWRIADWILEGLNQPEADASFVYDTGESLFQYSRPSLINFAYVARVFPESMRIDSDWLTFSHYQAVLAVGLQTPMPDNADKQRERLQWLVQAHEKRLTVSALRLGIANAFELATADNGNSNDTSQPTEQPPTKAKVAKVKPVSLGARLSGRVEQQLKTLANIRSISPDMLVAHIVDDYLAAHADEVATAADRLAKRQAEADAVIAAAQAVRESEIARRNEAYKAAEYHQRLVSKLRLLGHRLGQQVEVDQWLADYPNAPISELEVTVADFQKAFDEAEAMLQQKRIEALSPDNPVTPEQADDSPPEDTAEKNP